MFQENLSDFYELLTEKLINWYELGVKSIPNILAAVLILTGFVLLAKLSKKLSRKFLPKITKNRSVTNLLQTIIYMAIIIGGTFIALGVLNLDKTVTSLLAGAGVIGLAVGFAFQEIAANFFSGILIAFTEPYQIGDIVEAGGYTGEVTKVELRTTSITTFQGLEVLVPNKDMFTKPFSNLTTTPKRRIDLAVGVAYSDDLREVKSLVENTLTEIEERIPDKEVKVFFEEFGASSINFIAQLWIKYPGHQNYLEARSEAIMRIQEVFAKKDITIPFPIRTLEFPDSLEVQRS